MGTRALVKRNGKEWIRTHWDGDPQQLGKLLKRIRNSAEWKSGKLSESNILQIIHKAHDIDYHYRTSSRLSLKRGSKTLSYRRVRAPDLPGYHDYIYDIKRDGIYYKKSGKTKWYKLK